MRLEIKSLDYELRGMGLFEKIKKGIKGLWIEGYGICKEETRD